MAGALIAFVVIGLSLWSMHYLPKLHATGNCLPILGSWMLAYLLIVLCTRVLP